MKRARLIIVFLVWATANPALAATEDEDYQKNVFATFAAENWQASAAFFSADYTFGPQFQCRMQTAGATLTQIRPRESGAMPANWQLLTGLEQQSTGVEVDSVTLGSQRFETARLPWRLAAPTNDGIVLSFDVSLLAFRHGENTPWLPFEYLTAQMLEHDKMEVQYRHVGDNEGQSTRHGRQMVSLSGFRNVLRWCGRQLLRDRQDEPRVRDLVR